MAKTKSKTVRVELPVLLYVDLEIQTEPGESDIEAAQQVLFDQLGEPGEEIGINVDLGFGSYGRLYPSNLDFCDSRKHSKIVDVNED